MRVVSLRHARLPKLAAIMLVIATAVAAGLASHAGASPISRIAVIGDSYTAGSGEGGNGPRSWTELARRLLAQRRRRDRRRLAAEGGAGYGQRGSRGSVFQDLTAQAVTPQRRPGGVLRVAQRPTGGPAEVPGLAAEHLPTRPIRRAGRQVPGDRAAVADRQPAAGGAEDPRQPARQAAALGALFVDPIAEGWFVGRPDLIGQDGVHPTDAGHAYMADKIAPLIYDQLTIRV